MKSLALSLCSALLGTTLSITGGATAALAGSPPPTDDTSPPQKPAAGAAVAQPPQGAVVGKPAPTQPKPQTALPAPAPEPPLPVTVSSVPTPPRTGNDYDPLTSVEQMSERTIDGKVFKNANGTFTAWAYSGPIHYRDALGLWQEIDRSLVPGVDGAFHPRATGVDVALASNANSARLASVTVDPDHTISYRLDDAASAKGVVQGATMTYRDVRPSTDVELIALTEGVKETLILTSRSAPTSFTFPLTLRGLRASLAANGDIVYTDEDGLERARTPHGSMTDSAIDAGSGEGVKSYGVTYSLIPWGMGQALRMTLDAGWLADPARTYPVMVDPTTVTKLTESDDTYVQNGFTANNSLETELKIGTPNNVPNTTYSYMHFNTINSTYDNYYVSSAWLKMYEVHSYTCSPRTWHVYTVKASWGGTTTTHPGALYDTTPVTSVSSNKGDTCTGGPAWNSRIDVRSAVQAWNHGKANYGLTARPGSATDVTYWKRFASYQADPLNHSSAPRIEFTYSPQGARYDPSYAFTVNPTNNTNGKTKVTIRNWGHDTWPANGTYKLGYHVYDSAGTLVNWNGNRTAMPISVAPGELVTVDATIGKLPPGSYSIVFDMVQDGVTWFSDVGVDVPPGMAFTVTNQKPIITQVNGPADLAAVTTNRPTFSVTGSDPDAYPTGALQYYFRVCTGADAESGTGTNSGWITTPTWTPPANTLYWRTPYYWHAYIKDAGGAQTNPTWVWRFTPVVSDTSADAHFGADPYGISDGGVNVSVGNFVTGAIDATVATVGPPMSVSRTYNSQDTKVGRFGAGWTSLYDMTATADASGNVSVIHADGRKALYGKNPNGTYGASYGYYSTLKAVTGGGWTLTDKDATVYTFGSDGRLSSVKDRGGKQVTLVETNVGETTVTDVTSGRRIVLVRTTDDNLIRYARTDSLAAFGKPMEWRYFYTATKQLRAACDPRNPIDGGSCTKYEYLGVGGRLSKVTMPRGNSPVQIGYGVDGTVRTRTDGENNTWSYNPLYSEVTPTGPERHLEVIDPRLNRVEYVYADDTNRLLRRIDPLGKTRYLTYDTGTGYLSGIKDENGNQLTLTVDDRGNILTRSVPYGTGVATSYYTYFLAAEGVDDPRDNKLLTYRDARSTSATDNRYATTYDYMVGTGDLASVTMPCPNGITVCPKDALSYTDGTEPAVGSTGTQPAGLLKAETNAREHSTLYSYNSKGDLTRVVDRAGLRTEYTHDELGRRLTKTIYPAAHPGGLTTTVNYNIGGMVGGMDEPAVLDAVTNLTHRKRTTYVPDENGVVRDIVVSDLNGHDATRTTHIDVDNNDRTTLIRDPEGAVTIRTYDPEGNLDTVTDARGQKLDYDYDDVDRLATVTARGVVDDPTVPTPPRDVIVARNTYDAAGRLDRATDARGVVRDYDWYGDDRLASITVLGYRNTDGTTRNLVTEWHGYDPAGNETTTKLGGYLRTITRVFDNAGWVSSQTLDAATINRVTTYAHDPTGNIIRHTITDSTGRTEETRQEYNAAGLSTKQIVENGATDLVTVTERDDRGLVTKMRDPRGNAVAPVDPAYETSIVYSAMGQPVTVTGAQFLAENPGQTAAAARPVTKFGYDTFGNQVRMVDPRGNAHGAVYDKADRVTERTWPSYTPPGGVAVTPVEALTYSAAGDIKTFTDRRGSTTTFDYDSRGRLIRRTDPKPDATQPNPVTRTEYDDRGSVVASFDPTGALVEMGYDDLGRVRTRTNVVRNGTATPERFKSIFDYDDLSNVTKEVAPRGGTAYGSYNAASELIQYQDQAGALWKQRRDVAGRVTRSTDPLNRYQDTTFDQAGRPTSHATYSATGVLLRTENAGYDAAGNMTAYTPSASGPGVTTAATRTIAWNALNLLTAMTEPSSATVSSTTGFGYDLAGNRTRITDGNGNATTTTYTTWNQPETVLEPSTALYPEVANRQHITVYDKGGLPTENRAPGGVSVQRTFDALGRVTRELGVGAAGDKQLGYDLAGRLTAVSHPSGTQTFAYDDRGLLKSSAGPAGASSFGYDANGWMSNRTDAVGTTSFTWDARGLPETITDPITALTQTLAYEPDGQVKSRQYGAAGAKRSYTYDDFGRLATDTMTSPTGSTTASLAYGYDTSGNVTRVTQGGAVAGAGVNTYVYDLADRLTSWTAPNGAVTPYDYDKAGNRTRAGSTTYAYNERNWLLSDSAGTSYAYTRRGTLRTQTAGSTTISYTFDAFDRMTGDGSTTNTYDALDRLAVAGVAGFSYAGLDAEPVMSGTTKVARGPFGDPIAIGAGVMATAVMANQHGDITALINGIDGSVNGSTAYDPFGAVTARSGSSTPFGYQGQFTANTGRVHMQARWYTPGTGTFASRDTLAMSAARGAGANRYAYGIGNPVTNADPSGHGLACNNVDCDFAPMPKAPAPIVPPKPVSAPKPNPPASKGVGGGAWLARLGVVGGATLGFLLLMDSPAGDPYSCYDVNCAAAFGYEVDWDKVGHGTMKVTFTTTDLFDSARHGAPTLTVEITVTDKDGKKRTVKKIIPLPTKTDYWFAGSPPVYGLEVDAIDPLSNAVAASMAATPTATPVTGAVAEEGKSCGSGGDMGSCASKSRATAPRGCEVTGDATMLGCDPVAEADKGNGGNGDGGEPGTETASAGCDEIAGVTDPECTDVVPYKQYPDNNGFLGDPVEATLAVGTRISRYGTPGGNYASPEGTPFSARGMPPSMANSPYSVYEVVQPVSVQAGTIAPWAGSGGGGVQYRFFTSLADLVKQGVVKVVAP